MRVTQCRQVRHHQGQLSGQGFLAIGLAAFGVYLEVWPTDDDELTPLLFRILLNGFQAAMLAVLVINMVQAVEPMTLSVLSPKDRLLPWARRYLDDTVFDTQWSLTLIVAVLWGGIIAVVVTQLSYDEEHLGWTITIICLVVLGLSVASVNPGCALMGAWGVLWLVPVGLAFVWRSAFDTALMLINKVSLTWRRMANEVVAHVRTSTIGSCRPGSLLVLLLQVLPLAPLFLVSLPIPILYILVWFIHLSMRVFLRVADIMVAPLSDFRLHPILSDYGSVTWRMERLTMEVESRSMVSLLTARIEKLMETGTLGERVRGGELPSKPYWHLSKCSPEPRLGCITVATEEDREKMQSKTLLVSPNYVPKKLIEPAEEPAEDAAGPVDGTAEV